MIGVPSLTAGLQVLWAGFASLAFAIIFEVRGRVLPMSALGGASAWAVYLACLGAGEGYACLVASIYASLYAEILSSLSDRPALPFLVPSIIPLVPGGGMYYMMALFLGGDSEGALSKGAETLGMAGGIAAGIAVGGALTQLFSRLISKGKIRGER